MHRFWRIFFSRGVFDEMQDWTHCMHNGYQPAVCSIDQLANTPDTNDAAATIKNIFAFIDAENARDPRRYITVFIEFSDEVDAASTRASIIVPSDGKMIVIARNIHSSKPADPTTYLHPPISYNK